MAFKERWTVDSYARLLLGSDRRPLPPVLLRLYRVLAVFIRGFSCLQFTPVQREPMRCIAFYLLYVTLCDRESADYFITLIKDNWSANRSFEWKERVLRKDIIRQMNCRDLRDLRALLFGNESSLPKKRLYGCWEWETTDALTLAARIQVRVSSQGLPLALLFTVCVPGWLSRCLLLKHCVPWWALRSSRYYNVVKRLLPSDFWAERQEIIWWSHTIT